MNGKVDRHSKAIIRLCKLLLLFCLWLAPAFAGLDFRFRQLSLEEGLSQSTVFCVLQDHLGYLWLGTYDGLNKYDGYDFKQFKLDPNNPFSLSNNRVLALYEDQQGVLWVGTDGGGLNRLNRSTGGFDQFTHKKTQKGSLSHDRVRAILDDREGRLWVGTGGGGLNRLDRNSGQFTTYRRESAKPGSLSHNRVRTLLLDREGRLWVGTGGGGINLFVPETDSFIHYKHSASDAHSLSDNQVNALHEDQHGFLWVGTYSGGLNRFDPNTGNFEAYRNDPDDFHSLLSDTVNTLYEDDQEQFWVATDAGLDHFDRASQTFTHYRHKTNDPDSLSDNEILSLYQDRGGVFWIGSRNGGVNKFERGKQSFSLYQNQPDNLQSLADNRVNALFEDRVGNLWIGTSGSGLDRFDPLAGSFNHYRNSSTDPNSLSDDRVLSIRQDRQGTLWVGTRAGGLNRLEPGSNGVFESFKANPNIADSLASNTVWSLLLDHEDRLWVGTEAGLDLFMPEDQRFTHYRNDLDDPNSLSDNVVWSLLEDKQEQLWVGTENGGLNLMSEGQFSQFVYDEQDPHSLSHNTVLSLFEGLNHLWVGTWGGGLNRLDLASGAFEHFREKDGLPNDVVYGILGDGRGNLWLSTNRGLSYFNPETGAFRNWGTSDGLQGMEFNPGAFFRGAQGEMLFGGNNGFNAFHPDNFRENTHTPDILITTFKKNEDLVARDISNERSYELNFNDNYLSFEFVALDFNNPQQNRYAHQMEGVDLNWSQNNRRYAHYNNLEPGNYVFRVKGSNNDNLWNEKGVAVFIRIVPPFYRTYWFYSLGVFAVLALFVGIVIYQRRQLKYQESKALVALELKRKTAELEEARRLQLSMLPERVPSLPQLEIAVAMVTATEVGGDYYDFHIADDRVLTVAIGDATGHGVRAGTMVAATKGLFLSLICEHTPVDLLTRASAVLRKMGFRRVYMSMAVARFEAYQMTLAVAGMPPTYIYRSVSGLLESVVLKGLPMGGIAFPYSQETCQLAPGDLILLSSDGLEEMFNEQNQMLGSERICEALVSHAQESPNQIIEALLELGKAWAGNRVQDDDITLMLVRMK